MLPTASRTEPMASDVGAKQDPCHGDQLDQDFPVVGVGASAGGLEAFADLLHGLPADTGMAYVFIQHLEPNHESILAHLLSRESAMPVTQAEDGTVLLPNHVYVIPANAAMTVSGLVLALKPRVATATVIDTFLRSLAESRKNGAIAVILSGTGSDGALGVQAIAEEGGVVFAQDPVSAKFDGMPRSAIATGCVDFVLPTDAIAAEIPKIAREPHVIQRDIPAHSAEFPDSQNELQALLDLLLTATGIDFSLYRQTTVRRRVLRRIALLHQRNLGDYLRYVKEKPDELHTLAQEILIRVTHFFRDPEAFEGLRHTVFPTLIRKAPPDGGVRIWAAGCSTGEEAYSIAICFLEVAEQMQSRVPAQVFATDINEAAIERARRGAYIENIVADVSPERLARFFVRTGREFRVSRVLRELCIFSRHDLLNDPPFSRMDLVSCRNVLIYLDSMREYALSRFHFTLNRGGFLLLGRSETAGSSADLFAPLDKAAGLYVRQESASHPARARRKNVPVLSLQPGNSMPARLPGKIELRGRADRISAARYDPSQVIVNSDLEAVASSGENTNFPPPDSQNHKALEAVKRDHAGALKNATRTAGKTGQPIRIERVKVGEGAVTREVSIEVTPLGTERQHFLIVFEDQAGHPELDLESGETNPPGDGRKFEMLIKSLQDEVTSSRAQLESVIVEHAAVNEEVAASNEELQSLNEELESSKEELEATNAELTEVNQELEVRNTELDNAREFAQATVDTVRGSLVVLGPDLRVLKANQSFYRTFQMSPDEVEQRFIYELGDGRWRNPRLREMLEHALPGKRNVEDFEIEQEVPPMGQRILLLNARWFERDERILLAIEDVTESRRAAEELRESQKMEAIGYLAAGVAHDFNNLLTSIMGNASLLLEAVPKDSPSRSAAESVVSASEHAADLTRQLLAYAGKGRVHLERVNLSEVVMQTGRLIHSSIPASVQLRLDLDKHLPLLLADPSQMRQVAMNLVINGAEAIGTAEGAVLVATGRQTITNEPLPDLYPRERLAPGEYVFLEVQDNGSGMDEQTVRRIFDPFFTTKFTGRGLGLAAVLGIVRHHKGAVQVHSVPGRGSCFRVLLPATEKAELAIAEDVTRADLRGTGTVLVLDDEEVIRSFSRSALEPYGYTVLLARDSREGLQLFEAGPKDIGLVLLDVAMPIMDRLETLGRIRGIRPDVRVVICSGLGDVDIEARFAGNDIAGFLPKPYTARQLARKVKECMRPA
jgi:two-component system CheB/CheR fusion protein